MTEDGAIKEKFCQRVSFIYSIPFAEVVMSTPRRVRYFCSFFFRGAMGKPPQNSMVLFIILSPKTNAVVMQEKNNTNPTEKPTTPITIPQKSFTICSLSMAVNRTLLLQSRLGTPSWAWASTMLGLSLLTPVEKERPDLCAMTPVEKKRRLLGSGNL